MIDSKLTLVSEEIDAYCIRQSNAASATLRELEKYTRQNVPESVMLTGPLEGAFLGFLCKLVAARRVLEFGTYTGYSALCMAEALSDSGEVVTLDIDPKNTGIAQQYWGKSPHGSKIKLILGPAAETIRTLEGKFDLIFIDADKPGYWQYFQAALEKLNPQGIIVVDNCLFSGEVLDKAKRSANGEAIRQFNDLVAASTHLERVLLPVRDGIYLIRKKSV